MESLEILSKQLTYDEFSEAKGIFIMCQDKQIPVMKAAGMCYRAGRLKGKADAEAKMQQLHAAKRALREELKQLQTKYNELLSLPKASAETTKTELKQGDNTNE